VQQRQQCTYITQKDEAILNARNETHIKDIKMMS
jgi:hypothetical protein